MTEEPEEEDEEVVLVEEYKYKMIIFDLEMCCEFDSENSAMKHRVNCTCAQSVCDQCEDSEEPFCDNCNREHRVMFFGQNALAELCKWLFDAGDSKD